VDSRAASGEVAHGLQLLASGGHGGLDSGDLAEPALLLCLPEPVAEVGADLFKPRYLSWVDPEERASDTRFSELDRFVRFVLIDRM
jgi:hypothetical protein